MENLVWVLPFALALVVAMILGYISFSRQGRAARSRSNRLMRWRVGLQLGAVIVILIIMALYGVGG